MRVDDDLLALCNAAYDEAARRAAPRVEIAHLVWCLAVSAEARRWIDTAGLSRFALSVAVNRWLARTAVPSSGGAPETSAELKTLLGRAETIAGRHGAEHASPAHFLAALMMASADLPTAAFATGLHGRAMTLPDLHATPRSEPHFDARRIDEPRAAGTERDEARRDEIGRGDARGESRADARDRHRPPHQLHLNFDRSPPSPLSRASSPCRDETDDDDTDFDRETAEERHRDRDRDRDRNRDRDRHRNGDGDRGTAGDHRSPAPALHDRLARQEAEIAKLRAMLAKLLQASHDTDRRIAPGDDGDDSDHAHDGTSTERSRNRHRRNRGFRSRLRLRPGGWSRGNGRGQPGPSDRHRHEDDAQAEPPRRSPPRPRDAREADDYPMRMRAARNSASALREAMLSTPDNDIDDGAEATGDRMKRFYLSPDDDIVRAPSIGPRTAARLIPAGLVLVRDLLTCDPAEVAAKVGARYMTADRIGDWKAQARLVCTIPWLRGTHAQLLVGAGYDTIGKLARADASIVCAAILRFAATREGQSILRSGPPPEIDRIACWIENTALAEPQRAA